MDMTPLVLVLAGGEGRRIGGDKALREIGGRRLIDIAVARARTWSKGGVLVAGPALPHCARGVRWIADRPDISGPLSGLASGLQFAADTGVALLLVMPVDTPFLPADLPLRLSEALHPDGDVGCAVASSAGRRHPACSLWRVEQAMAALPAHIADSDLSLHGFADSIGAAVVEWPLEDCRDPFFNVNRPDDLALAEGLLRTLPQAVREG